MPEVVIVGGGPVGLYLGRLLLQAGVDTLVLERRTARSAHSRAIGIHPPALDVLGATGAAAPLVAAGVAIRAGTARSAGRDVAGLCFDHVSPRYPYVLAVPQAVTEQVLEANLLEADSGALIRGADVRDLHDDGRRVALTAQLDGRPARFEASLVIAADGARSRIRGCLGVRTDGSAYPDTYVMGDFADNTGDGSTAVLYLEPGGIIESFPLPHGLRRWVVRTPALLPDPSPEALAALVLNRTGRSIPVETNTMVSSFAVRSRLARRMVVGRTALIGDAAHEVSPIGGQGMSLGWLDAAALAPIISAALAGRSTGAQLRAFEAARRRAAVTAARQAHLNMALGRPLPASALAARNRLFAGLLQAPGTSRFIARRFTMQ